MMSRAMSRSRLGHEAGVTLVELLMSAAVLALILGAIGAMYLAGIRAWYSETAAATADNQARWALKWMMPVVREARRVRPAFSNHHRLTFIQPQAQLTAPISVTYGDTISIYLGDAAGAASTSGNSLWFSRNGTPVRALAHGLVKPDGSPGFEVEYIKQDGSVQTDVDQTTVHGLVGVRLILTARGHKGGQIRYLTMARTVPLRNLE